MPVDSDVKQEVQQFYDLVGWQKVDSDVYENALYEDLRPVSQEYIHRCHLRINRHLSPSGTFLLDAGSGPVQYPEYLVYSENYRRRVCADISIVAIREARRRLGDHGLYVVADIANLPFRKDAFDGVVSLHTIHHLPQDEHVDAYEELYRVLKPERNAVVVVGWRKPSLTRLLNLPHRLQKRFRRLRRRVRQPDRSSGPKSMEAEILGSKGTFASKYNAAWLKQELGARMPFEILVWRSVGVRTMRLYIHERLGGRLWLRLLFWLEERLPHYFGEHGSYPLIVIRKPGKLGETR